MLKKGNIPAGIPTEDGAFQAVPIRIKLRVLFPQTVCRERTRCRWSEGRRRAELQFTPAARSPFPTEHGAIVSLTGYVWDGLAGRPIEANA